MTSVSRHRPGSELAVFAINHLDHLKEAARASQRDPAVRRTFRSRRRWVTAARAVKQDGPRRVYFAVVDSGPIIQYEAALVEVYVNPNRTAVRTKRLLGCSGETTKGENLWHDTVQTLYVISDCRKLTRRFPQTELQKFKGGLPLAANYTRPYALVRLRKGAP
jgi:hypothetical protein